MRSRKSKTQNTLWTKDFTILTLGSIISKLGSAVSGFAMGLLVLDYSGSTFLYALFLVMYSAPKVVMPVLAGPYLDKFSRKKVIYTLDFMSTLVYAGFAAIIGTGHFSYAVLIVGCLIIGSIDSIYTVAYESLYPMLIKEGNYSKAYSISSTLETMTLVMVPISVVLYKWIGIVPLFIMNAVSFLLAAIFETQISVNERYMYEEAEGKTDDGAAKESVEGELPETKKGAKYTLSNYKADFVEGMRYLKGEKGLLAITLYFTVSMFATGAFDAIVLPFIKSSYKNGEFVYIIVLGCLMVGKMFGGVLHYRFKYPAKYKFKIAIFVYIAICILDGGFLYFSIPVMMVACFFNGVLGVTSYNIRISSVQSYVEDSRKGRFNGIFQMLVMIGMSLGQLLSGLLADIFSGRIVLSGFMVVNFFAVILIMYRSKEKVKLIYNRQA
ncbi:MAG TPA: MFS transporter [Lachnospiraceae bacterium]|nr:MFS transporter [Lachnospiraceae bacterium]